jgi:predicted histone-like DNA-binding protein
MFVKYKVVERGYPGAGTEGPKKFYASVSSNGELNMEDLTAKVEEISTAHGTDIRAVVYALFSVMKSALAEGKIVRLGELGSLRISISSNGEETEDAVSANSIRSSKLQLIPSPQVKKMLKTLEFRKA